MSIEQNCTEKINSKVLENSLTQKEFVEHIHSVLNSDSHEAPYDDEDYLNFTKVNLRRYDGFEKKVELTEDIKEEVTNGINNWTFVLLNEPWCSDGSFSQPVINKIANASNGSIELKVLLRDQNLDLMDQFLTNGGRAIPKLIIINEKNEVIGDWGPRSKELQDQVMEMKNDPNLTYIDKIKVSNRWYMKDKGQSIQADLLKIIRASKKK